MSETPVLQVRMKQITLHQLLSLQERLKALSKSDAIRKTIEISDMIVEAVEKGSRILIETKDGQQRQILISGLNVNRLDN